MTDPTQQPTEGTTETPPAAPQTPPATTPPQPPASPKPGLDPAVYAPDGKTWKDKYFGEQGRRQQVENQSATQAGSLEAQLEAAQRDVKVKEAEIARLSATIADQEQKIAAIPELQGQIDALTPQASRASRLELLTQFPSLLAVQVEEQYTPEGAEEPQTRQVNPFMSLINNTTLEGDALAQELRRMSTAIGTSPDAAPPPVVAGAVPPPAAPAPTSGAEALRAKAMEWHRLVTNGVTRTEDGKDPLEEERKAWSAVEEALRATNE